ncbi:MAG: hypothetical protein HYW01_13355 [Deltaproteobacteria bacterium]|nr:hypothetical protein [Deltaproteobacteria bacterium]
MSLLKYGPAKTILVILAIVFSLIFISFIYVSKFVVPEQIRSYIEEVSKENEYKIEIKDIEYDFFSGLKGRHIEISDPISLVKPILKAGGIAIQPELLSSLINWKVKVKRIIIDKPIISLTREELDNLMKLIGKGEEKEKPIPIEIEHVEIRNAEIKLPPGILMSSKKIELDMVDAKSEEERTINLSGSVNLKDNEMEFQGKIKPFLDIPNGEIKIDLPVLNTDSFSTDFQLPVKLSIYSDLKVQISNNITSQGTFNFVSSEKSSQKSPVLSGKLEYDLAYDKLVDRAFIKSANLNIEKLIQLSVSGSIEKLRKEGVFNLKVMTDGIKLENIPELFPDLSHFTFSGEVETSNIKITGSRIDKDISLSGRTVLREVGINDKKNDFKINGLKGSLDFEKTFDNQTSSNISADGNFSLKSISTKIGELTGVLGNIELSTDGNGSDKKINLSSLKASFLEGQLSGDIVFRFLDGKRTLEGSLEGKNLSLNKIPENNIFTDFEGNIEELRAKFISENMNDFIADLSLTIRDFKLVAGEKGIIEISRAKSLEPLEIKFSLKAENPELETENFNQNQNSDSKETLENRGNRISVQSKGVYFENLSYNEFSIKKGTIDELLFKLLENKNWSLNIGSVGSEFQIADRDVYLKQFQLDIDTAKNGGVVIWGNLKGKEGGYGEISFPSLSSDFKFNDKLLQLTNLKTQLENYGELETKELNILFAESEHYNISFSQGDFSGFDEKLKSVGIKGELVFYTGDNDKTSWDGNIFIEKTNISSQPFNDLSIRIKSTQDGINVEKISGKFLDGDLKGNVFIKTAQSPTIISSQIELEKGSVPLDIFKLSLGKLDFNFKGNIKNGSLPQGTGGISFSDLSMEKDGAVSSLKGEMQIETVGETISLKNGFIENEGGNRINLTAKMENPLNGDRSLQLDLSQIPLDFLQKTFSPILPQGLKEGEIKGNLGLSLIFSQFLLEGASWDGELSIKDVSFNGKFQDTIFLINDVNGTIPIRNNGKPGISLVSFMRNYGETDKLLNKKVFENFLGAAKQNGLENKGDLLRIREIEYGFLRLEDIECDVELNKSILNLRRLQSKLYEGEAFGTGLLDLSGKDKFNLSLLFKNISLNSISSSIPSAKDYITGRINGLVWVRGNGKKLNTLDGTFNFWTIDSKEPKRIAKALLQKLGVKEKLLLRSSRKYDKGVISGYIKDGVITFRELNISNRILGIVQDLAIKVDEKRNSISVAHFLSVIRETAKRASKGELKIEYEK